MNNKARILILASVAATLLACTRDDAFQRAEQIELRLSGAISMTTRGNYSPTQSTALTAGEAVYAWVDDRGDATATPPIPPSEHVLAWNLTCDAYGALSGANKYYFPASGRSVNVYAVHGNFTAPTEGTTGWDSFNPVTHSVEADQSAAGAYEKSDFLFARNTSIVRDNTTKLLNFSHTLSKIEVYLIAGSGLVDADITGATVKVIGTLPTATVTLSKSDTPDATVAASGTATDIQCRMTYRTDVEVAGTGGKYAYAFGEAIVIPQTLTTPVQLLEITLPNTGIVLRTSADSYTFEKGKRYGYNVTVNSKDLELTSIITDWDDSPGTVNLVAQ